MKLGDLIDAIRNAERAEHNVREAERALTFGGSEETMRGKNRMLRYALADLAAIREAEIEL